MANKLELTWYGKDEPIRVEPRLLIENTALSNTAADPDTQNMLIHGDNLLALKALESKFAGQVKCIYIDPPFNTGQAFENYDDNLEMSIWLDLMRSRLQIIHTLLKDDGTLFVHIDDQNLPYLTLLLDEIFGKQNRLYLITFKQGAATGHKAINPGCVTTTNFILMSSTGSAESVVSTIEDDKVALADYVIKAKSKILNLAIRGQLVPQDPADEPASVLLERIRAEKEELIKQGKIKRDKKESVIFRGEDNSYYLRTGALVESLEDWDFEELPDGWSVCCLGELCDYGNCTNIDTADIANSAWILDLEDIEKDSGVVLQKVRQGERNAESTKHRFHKGQVLYSKLRPYLNKVVLADEDGYCTSEILPLEFERNILPQYARYFLMSPTFLRYANKCSYGVKMPRLGTTDGKKAIVSVPPIEEQKRIVMAIELAFAQLASITENLN